MSSAPRFLLLTALLWACGSAEPDESSSEPPPATVGDDTAAADSFDEPVEEGEPPADDTGVASADEQRQPSGAADSPPQYACRLAPDYNECIVERLEGRATTEADLVALIQSYRMLGRGDDARAQMEEFIRRYPDSPQAQTYRDYLGGY